jgi:hypothetical protein
VSVFGKDNGPLRVESVRVGVFDKLPLRFKAADFLLALVERQKCADWPLKTTGPIMAASKKLIS